MTATPTEYFVKMPDGSLQPIAWPPAKPTQINFLLDESGSMAKIFDETVSGFNEYVRSLRADGQDSDRLTLVKFNSNYQYRVVCEAAPLGQVPQLGVGNYAPVGGTPLYDALGRLLETTQDATRRVITVILTDGEENQSSRYNLVTINSLIKKLEAAGQAFIYLGVSPEAWTNDRMFANTVSRTNFVGSAGAQAMPHVYAAAAMSTREYRNTGAQADLVSAADRKTVADASGLTVGQTTGPSTTPAP